MTIKCVCGCAALPHPETRALQLMLERKGFNCTQLPFCSSRFTVIGTIDDLQENQVVDLLETIKGVMFEYIVENDGVHHTVHCHVVL